VAPSIAAGRAAKGAMSEHKDVRVRASAREARSKGSLADTMSARPLRPARMVLATFAETKVARSPGRRAEKDMDVVQ